MRKSRSPAVPAAMNGRLRPHGVIVRSETPPTTGCQRIATSVPRDLRTLAARPSCARPTNWMIMSGRIRAVRLFHRYPIATQYSDRMMKSRWFSRRGGATTAATCRGPREIKAQPQISWGFLNRAGKAERLFDRTVFAIAERVLTLQDGVHLACPFVDDRRAGVAQEALDRIFRRIAVRAMHLDGVMRGIERGIGRVLLGHRDLPRVAR